MTIKICAAALSAGLLFAGVAVAQTSSSGGSTPPYPAPPLSPADSSSAAAAPAYAPPAAKTGKVVPINVDAAAAAGVTVEVVTNGPVPDTAQSRAENGGPDSQAGALTRAAGN